MDNNDNDNSFFGPLIAKFHLHHKKPIYKKKNIFIVYFNESGSKIWLALIQIIFIFLIVTNSINNTFAVIFVFFSFLSSLAEISHYLCHVSKSKIFIFLGKLRIVLNKKHHGKHHLEDNKNYAFLNGVSDPIINYIAKKLFLSYKETTDKHYLLYGKQQIKNDN
jgi:sterol desaturase/sphingolipid hydroxylase (fatty acid hydroxylase superfamily)